MDVRGKQWLVALVGTALTLSMLWLGLWQMQVFEDKENQSAAARAAQPPVTLLDLVATDGTVGDVYGKRGIVEGRYLPDQQLPVVAADGTTRVVTAFVLADGRVLPVVRGTVPAASGTLPRPPTGRLTVVGVFLPSEAGADHPVPTGALGSVRLPALAQLWSQQLLPGFITLSGHDSAAQGLGAAGTTLPTGEGSMQNAGYALQWWVFAAFGAFMTVRFVRTIGRQGSLGTLSTQEDE